jgi:hypothetical protein
MRHRTICLVILLALVAGTGPTTQAQTMQCSPNPAGAICTGAEGARPVCVSSASGTMTCYSQSAPTDQAPAPCVSCPAPPSGPEVDNTLWHNPPSSY